MIDPSVSRPPRLYLLVGVPGCGKSTYARQQLRHCLRISLDDLRLMLSGTFYDRTIEPAVAALGAVSLGTLLRRLRSWRRNAVLDATNVTRALRARGVSMAHRHGVDVVAVYFDCPIEVALARNTGRPASVPEDVIRHFHAELEPPSLNEGFAEIIRIKVGAT